MAYRNFQKILVANRSEIAIRVFRAATELGLRTVAIFSEEDKNALHRYKADEAYVIGKGLGPLRAYLAIDQIVELALEKGVDAIHPGYGFLAENADFAKACEKAGVAFIGPSSDLIAEMGDKMRARRVAEEIGLPLVPGVSRPVSLETAQGFARKHRYPIILKAAFGGGGRGMRVVRKADELKRLFGEAEREAKTAFGRPELFVEKYVARPKHIEVQILGDGHGNVVHLFERDCSIQRRHQKVIELAPAPLFLLDGGREIAERIHSAAVAISGKVGYTNAGTVEFLYDEDEKQFYFMEMNTRIQVEHTVTEMVTGVDLVKAQIRIAEGRPLTDPEIGIADQSAIGVRGVAIQCRITTEDPTGDFMPDYGRLAVYRSPAGHGVRLDAGSAHVGAVITPYYDSLLVKVTTVGRNLAESARRMDRCLAEFRIRGVKTNIAFLRAVMREEEFLRGEFRTDYLEKHPELCVGEASQDRASKLLAFIGNVHINGNEIMKGRARPAVLRWPEPPESGHGGSPDSGTKQLLEKLGAEKFCKWIMREKRLLITDTTVRDAQQSLLATRMRTHDMVRVAGFMARRAPEMFSYEVWGGATFDSSLRFLKEDPWERLEAIRKAVPNTLLQMLLRGANAVGYTNYPENIVREFVRLSAESGVDLFRIFDSLNYLDNMRPAIDAVRESGMLAEAAICYTGNIEDPGRRKYTLRYYVSLAKALEKSGAQILAIKDMAGLLRPFSAKILVKALRDELDIPIHLHTHDTGGVQGATLLMAAEVGVDVVDGALAAMSGLTAQVNLNSLVAALEHHPRSTGLDLNALNESSAYWEEVRANYSPFESELKSSTADVYDHEMPGGQYTNLRAQAEALNLGERWRDVVEAYKAANRLFGDIVKVTPSSKVVGDMALFMAANRLTEANFFEKAKSLSFPESVMGMMRGELGRPHQGFPTKVKRAILRGEKPPRPKKLKPVNLAETAEELKRRLGRGTPRGAKLSERDIMSYVMYPQVTVDYLKHRAEYGDVSALPTPVFFYGIQPGEETTIDIEDGKTLYVRLIAVSEADIEGIRTLFFELNGFPRDVRIKDNRIKSGKTSRPKADPENLHQVGAAIPGRVVQIQVKPGDVVKKGDTFFVMEAMKLETTVTAPLDGAIKEVYVAEGNVVEAGDLIITYR